MSKIWQGCPIPKCRRRVFLRTSMSKLWQGFLIPNYQMPMIVEWAGFAICTLTCHLVLNKPAILFVQFHQNQPNLRIAYMISPLYVAMPWTYRHLLSFGGNQWFDVFMNILCSSHWNQAEHPCLHKYKKVISIKQTVLWIDSLNRHLHGPCRDTFRKMELAGKNPRTTLYSRITARKWRFVSPSELKLVWSCGE